MTGIEPLPGAPSSSASGGTVPLWLRLLGVRPGDDAEERTRKGILGTYGLFLFLGIPMDAAALLAEGETSTAGVLLAWSIFTGLGYAWYLWTGSRTGFQRSQFAAMLVAPLSMHILAGWEAATRSGLAWTALSPVGALLLSPRPEARLWFFTWLLSTGAVGMLDPMAPLAAGRFATSTARYFHVSVILGLPALLLFLVDHFLQRLLEARTALAAEHDRSERLLRNILPPSVAERLKNGEEPIADRFEEVTVLFADLKGFTPLATTTPAPRLVEILNRMYREIDALAAGLGVEKIKTIGDAYMAAAGVPDPHPRHAEAAASLGLAMLEAVERVNRELGIALQLRVGLHTGPAVAGVIGTRKFAYDLWGDAVNTASRMESHGVPGRVHLSAETRARLGDEFPCEDRGEIEVKGKGPMRTYLLVSAARPG